MIKKNIYRQIVFVKSYIGFVKQNTKFLSIVFVMIYVIDFDYVNRFNDI